MAKKTKELTDVLWDRNCPNIQLQGEYVGEWNCKLQDYEYGEFGGNTGYRSCLYSDHNNCPIYKKAHSGVKSNE